MMNAVQLRAELFREMSPLLDSETAMTKVLMYVRTLLSAPSATAKEDEQIRMALKDLSIPAKLRNKRGCIKMTEEDLRDERIQYILNK